MWIIDVGGCVRTVVAGRCGRDSVARPCRGISSGEVSFRYPVLTVNYAAAQVDGPVEKLLDSSYLRSLKGKVGSAEFVTS